MSINHITNLVQLVQALHLKSSHIQSDIDDENAIVLPDAVPDSIKKSVTDYKTKLINVKTSIASDTTISVLEDKLNEIIDAVNKNALDIADLKASLTSQVDSLTTQLKSAQDSATAAQAAADANKKAADYLAAAAKKAATTVKTPVVATKGGVAVTSTIQIGSKNITASPLVTK